jgi:IS30 family transposase
VRSMKSEVEDSTAPARKRTHKFSPRKIDPKKVRALHRAGLNQSDIAKQQGVRQSTIWRFLQREKPEMEYLERFKTNRADEMANLQGKTIGLQHEVLDSLHRDLQEDRVSRILPVATKGNLLNALNNVQGTIFDKERLERGESTSNVSIISRMVDSRVTSRYKRKSLEGQASPSESE